MAGKVALLDLRQLRFQRLNHASMKVLQTPLKDGVLSSCSFLFLLLSCLPFSLHSPSVKFKAELSRNWFFWWTFSQCWCETLRNLCLQYISYSSLTWTCLECSRAAVWSLLQQGPQVLPQSSHKAASALNEVAVLEVVDISSSWRGTWESINICRKNSN